MVPFAVSGRQVATIDPTVFAMTERNLMDFSRSVSDVLFERLDDMDATAGSSLGFASESGTKAGPLDAIDGVPSLSAYANESIIFKNRAVKYSDGTTIWSRGFAGERVQQEDGVLLHTLNQFYGGMIGGDWEPRLNLRLGAFVGAGKTRSSEERDMGSANTALIFGGFYGRYSWNTSFFGAALQAGHLDTDAHRNHINNNLVPGGLETADASYGGWYISPELTYGVHYALGFLEGASFTLTPSVNFRYLYGSFDPYTESGTTAPLTVGVRAMNDFEERGQIKFTRKQTFTPTEVLLANIYGGVLGLQRGGSDTINAALLGQSIPFATPGKNDVWGGYAGAGLELETGRVALFVSVEYLALSDSSSVISGQGGISVAF